MRPRPTSASAGEPHLTQGTLALAVRRVAARVLGRRWAHRRRSWSRRSRGTRPSTGSPRPERRGRRVGSALRCAARRAQSATASAVCQLDVTALVLGVLVGCFIPASCEGKRQPLRALLRRRLGLSAVMQAEWHRHNRRSYLVSSSSTPALASPPTRSPRGNRRGADSDPDVDDHALRAVGAVGRGAEGARAGREPQVSGLLERWPLERSGVARQAPGKDTRLRRVEKADV